MAGRPPRVVHVAPYWPPHLGGMENVARAIAERTAAAGLDVSVVTTRIPWRAGAPSAGVRVRRCAAIEVAHTPVAPGLVPAILAVSTGAILHVHVGQPLIPEQAFVAARLRGRPYVAHLHLDVGPSGPLGVLLPAYKRALLGPVLRRATRVVVYGRSDAGLVEARYGVPPGRIVAIPGGVDLPPAPLAAPAGGGAETVLFVGRLSRQKNLPVLVEAVGLLAARGRATRLRIVGQGEEEGAVRARIRDLGLGDRATLVGRVEGERLSAELRAATVLALPSARESMGLVLVEAMAHGLPVVAADVGGIRDVVEDGRTGLLAAPEPRAFADALGRALADAPLRGALTRDGLAAARAFAWDRIVPRWLDLYARVAAERSPSKSRS